MHLFAAMLLIATLNQQAEPIVSSPAGVRPDSTIRFPKVDGSNLESRRFSLPAEFEGELNIVLVAFRREQQADVDTWVPFLKATAGRHAAVRAYELPTLSRGYRVMRGFIDGGMARGIPEKATREATITLYIDKKPFKKALGITSEDRIVTLLVTRDGRVLWRADGRHSDESAAELASEIERRVRASAP